MTLDTRARQTASDLITKFGKSLTLKTVVNGTYDPATGEITNTETTATVLGIVKDYASNEIDGTMVLVGDRKVSIAALGNTEPQTTDKITIDGVDWQVVAVSGIWSGELKAMHVIQVRK